MSPYEPHGFVPRWEWTEVTYVHVKTIWVVRDTNRGVDRRSWCPRSGTVPSDSTLDDGLERRRPLLESPHLTTVRNPYSQQTGEQNTKRY